LNRPDEAATIVSTINFMMDTMTTAKKQTRRNHSPALKAQMLAECEAHGSSVDKVAMAHGINAIIVHGWRKARGNRGPGRLRCRHSCHCRSKLRRLWFGESRWKCDAGLCR
jgi:hypothetical protein